MTIKLRRRIEYELTRHVRVNGFNLQLKIAGWLPRWLVRAAFIRLSAYATMGRYGNTDPGKISVMETLNRWDT